MILIVPDGLNPGTHFVINLEHVRELVVGTMRPDVADNDAQPTRDGMPAGEVEAPDYIEIQWDNGATVTRWMPKGSGAELIAQIRAASSAGSPRWRMN